MGAWWEFLGQDQIRFLVGLREPVMRQVVMTIALKTGKDRTTAKPFSGPFVQGKGFEERVMDRFMHQDREAQLPRADDHDWLGPR